MARSSLLKTKRLIIRPFTKKYLTERYVSWLNDPLVVKFSDQRYRKHFLRGCRDYMKSFDKSPNYFWAIEAKDKKIGHIGNINTYVDIKNNTADLGILLGERSVWGCGYAYEAWMAVIDYLLRKKGIRKITAGTLSVNRNMLNLMKRSGMASDGIRKKHCIFEGREVDLVYSALFNNEGKRHNG